MKNSKINFGNKTIIVHEDSGICMSVDTMYLHKYDDGVIQQICGEAESLMRARWVSLNTVYLFVTDDCNLSCQFCAMRSDSTKEKKNISLENIKKNIIPHLIRLNPKRIIISGGEPLLLSGIVDIIECLKNKVESRIILQSNGTLLSNEMIKRLSGKIHTIEISTAHYKSLEKLEDSIVLCQNENIDVTLSYVYERDINMFYKIIDLVAKYNIEFLLNFVALSGSALDHNYECMNSNQRGKVFCDLAKYIIKQNYCDKVVADLLFQPIQAAKPCGAYGKIVAIYPDGQMYPCHSLNYKEFEIGNIFAMNVNENIISKIQKLIDKESVGRFFDKSNNEQCIGCKFQPICGGLCPADQYNQERIECEHRKIMYIYNMFFYSEKRNTKENLYSFIDFHQNQKFIEYLL